MYDGLLVTYAYMHGSVSLQLIVGEASINKADKSVQQVMHVGADAWVTARRRRRQRADKEAWTRRHKLIRDGYVQR
jgi:hypothetical protein